LLGLPWPLIMNFSSAERFMSIPWCCYPQHILGAEDLRNSASVSRS
jgi:hypothetical protein